MKKIILLTFLIIGFLAISTVNVEEIANETSNLGIAESNNVIIDGSDENASVIGYEDNTNNVNNSDELNNVISTSFEEMDEFTYWGNSLNVTKIKTWYYDKQSNVVNSNDYVNIYQYGNKNQFIDIQMKKSFSGTIEFSYYTYDYITRRSLYYGVKSDTKYFYKYNGRQTFTFDLRNREPGQVLIRVNQNENSHEHTCVAETIFYITKGIAAPDVIKYYKGDEQFVVSTFDNKNKPICDENVVIIINGNMYAKKTNSLGIATLALNLNIGEYNVTTIAYKNTVFSKVIIKPTIAANDFTKIYKNGTQYYATFRDSQGNLLRNTDVKFNINGVIYTRTTNDKGIAKMNINLNPGTYILTAENPSNGERRGNKITVLPNIIENHDLTKYYKNDSQYSVRLLNDFGKTVGGNVKVTFNINGVFYTRTTDTWGYATLNINLDAGEYIITAQYKGCAVSNRIKVLPILSANDLTMSYKDGSKFAVKLLDGQGKPFAGQDVTMNINGVFYDRVTDDSGVARLNINLLPNEYIITSSYNGFSIGNKILIKASNNQQSNPAGNPTNNPISNSTTNTGSNTSFVPYDLDKAIIVDINTYNKYITKYSDNYKLEAYVYQNSNTGIDISLSNRKISGTGAYGYVNKNYYVSSIYSNMTGTWQWSDWKVGEGVSASTIHKYSYGSNNFAVTKVAVKIIDGLSDDGYSFYPTDPHMPDVDSHGITREYAIAHNMHYIQGDGDWSGGYVNYDAVNKCYHA